MPTIRHITFYILRSKRKIVFELLLYYKRVRVLFGFNPLKQSPCIKRLTTCIVHFQYNIIIYYNQQNYNIFHSQAIFMVKLHILNAHLYVQAYI